MAEELISTIMLKHYQNKFSKQRKHMELKLSDQTVKKTKTVQYYLLQWLQV